MSVPRARKAERRKTWLYRLYDHDDRLLYVGVTFDADNRISTHLKKPWGHKVARAELDFYLTRARAEQVEAAWIKREAPIYNSAENESNPAHLREWYQACRRRPHLTDALPAPLATPVETWQLGDDILRDELGIEPTRRLGQTAVWDALGEVIDDLEHVYRDESLASAPTADEHWSYWAGRQVLADRIQDAFCDPEPVT